MEGQITRSMRRLYEYMFGIFDLEALAGALVGIAIAAGLMRWAVGYEASVETALLGLVIVAFWYYRAKRKSK